MSDYRECSQCHTERLASTLSATNTCPFCEEPVPEQPEPEPELKKTRRKRSTAVKPLPEQVSEEPVSEKLATKSEIEPYVAPQFDATTAEANPQQEIARRLLCRRKLLPFIQRFRPKYLPGWVHEDICRRLERFVQQVAERKSPRLLLMCPPRMGKSEIGSRHLPAWVLGQFPDWEIIATSHTSSLTLSFSRYIRDLMRDPAYHAVFDNGRLDPSSQSIENWNTTSGGGYLAAGVGTGITGRGAHILLLDDLVKDIEAADSPTISDNTWEWYGSTAYTRLAPGGGVLGIMTWWSDTDWAGRIQETMKSGDGDMFEIVKYPAINEEGDEYILPDDTIRQFSKLDDPPPPSSILTRHHNTAVHPARYDTEAMLRIKRNLVATGQKRVWQALYQQNPTPDDGLFFTKEMFRLTPTIPARARCKVYQAWDFAISEGKESDYTVGSTLFQDEDDNLYVADIRRFRSSDSNYIIDMILDYAQEYQHKNSLPSLGFEDGQIWKTMEAQFTKRCAERRIYPSYEVLKPLTDKMVRAHPLRGRMQTGKIWFNPQAPYYHDLFSEMTRFPAGKHDDQIDSLAWCVRLTLGQSAPRPLNQPKKIKSWKDTLPGMSAAGASHLAA